MGTTGYCPSPPRPVPCKAWRQLAVAGEDRERGGPEALLLPALDWARHAAVRKGHLAGAGGASRSQPRAKEILPSIPTHEQPLQVDPQPASRPPARPPQRHFHHAETPGAASATAARRAVWFREYDLFQPFWACASAAAPGRTLGEAAESMLESVWKTCYDELLPPGPPRPATDSPPGSRQPGNGGGRCRARQAAGGDGRTACFWATTTTGTLKHVMQSSRHPAVTAMIETLAHSPPRA